MKFLESIVIGSDHAGYEMKQALVSWGKENGVTLLDAGSMNADPVDYPDYAHKVSHFILSQKANTGILVCGTGIGVSMAANRHKGIRAALCRSVEDAALARQHNNANVLCLGERCTSAAAAKEILAIFLATPFDGGRHEGRVKKMG